MANPVNVAEAKKKLSELMGRVAYNGERFLIERRGKPMAALVSADDLARLEEDAVDTVGLLGAVGALADIEGPDLDQFLKDVDRHREEAGDRDVHLEV